MEDRKYCVYAHTNKVNGKKYIGMTGLKPHARWNNGNGYCYQEEFWNDIQEFGWDGFNHEILFDNLTKEEAQLKETEMITKYQTVDSAFGYNKACSCRILKMNNMTKAEPLQGIRRLVYCVELDKTFKSATAAAKELKLNNSHISACCRGERQACGGYHFKYLEYGDDTVYCIETDSFYGSPAIAATKLNLHSASVKKVCQGVLQTTGKKHFRFATLEEKEMLKKIS